MAKQSNFENTLFLRKKLCGYKDFYMLFYITAKIRMYKNDLRSNYIKYIINLYKLNIQIKNSRVMNNRQATCNKIFKFRLIDYTLYKFINFLLNRFFIFSFYTSYIYNLSNISVNNSHGIKHIESTRKFNKSLNINPINNSLQAVGINIFSTVQSVCYQVNLNIKNMYKIYIPNWYKNYMQGYFARLNLDSRKMYQIKPCFLSLKSFKRIDYLYSLFCSYLSLSKNNLLLKPIYNQEFLEKKESVQNTWIHKFWITKFL